MASNKRAIDPLDRTFNRLWREWLVEEGEDVAGETLDSAIIKEIARTWWKKGREGDDNDQQRRNQ